MHANYVTGCDLTTVIIKHTCNICRVQKCHAASTLHCSASLAIFNLSASPFFKHSQAFLHKNKALLSAISQQKWPRYMYISTESLKHLLHGQMSKIHPFLRHPCVQDRLESLICYYFVPTKEMLISKVMEGY